ncbi:MAG: C25 family cysteine peptidase, partial [Chloroflexaceae bacterium]|nr:C25 family cysteine peptidase [Chloroflexaceae bacterium]
MHRAFVLLGFCVCLLASSTAFAQVPPPEEPFLATNESAGVRLTWRGSVQPDASGAPAVAGWPSGTLGGALLPVQQVALTLPDGAAVVPQLTVASQPWTGAVPAAPQPAPPETGLRMREPAATLVALPDAAVTVLRDGRMQGQRVVVLAVSPIFQQNGQTLASSAIEAFVPGARLFDPNATPPTAADGVTLTATPPAPNGRAAAPATKIVVTQAGIQRVQAAALAAAGLNPATLDAARLRLWWKGAEVPLDVRGSGNSLELRFYAPEPGDRWNSSDVYWLTLDAAPGLRMASRSVAPGGAALRNTALQRGTWRNNTRYDSTTSGPDGDHWFAFNLQAVPNGTPATTVITPALTLPAAGGPVNLTLNGASFSTGQHSLRMSMGGAEQTAIVSTSQQGQNWTQNFSLSNSAATASVALLPGSAIRDLLLDSVHWEFPVSLDLGERGAAFTGVGGTWRYQLSNLPADAALYDISDPRQPVLLTGVAATFEDTGDRAYLLAGPGSMHTPELRAHQPVDLAAALNVQALYIAPAAFQQALEPLVAQRRSQGYSVQVVPVEAIYDNWSWGMVSPDAIRNFLRYAVGTWATKPQAVALVGIGTSDPRNYLGRNNPNHIPPYLADVDFWLGETACENCYVQLDGDSPLDDKLPDLALGRLPARDANDVQVLVNKILAYERAPAGQSWRGRALTVADNNDSAGDFVKIADAGTTHLPAGMLSERIYFDPEAPAEQPWRDRDAARAYSRVKAALSGGAGLVTFVGHSSQWRWASNSYQSTPNGNTEFLPMLDLYDTDELQNGPRQPIV